MLNKIRSSINRNVKIGIVSLSALLWISWCSVGGSDNTITSFDNSTISLKIQAWNVLWSSVEISTVEWVFLTSGYTDSNWNIIINKTELYLNITLNWITWNPLLEVVWIGGIDTDPDDDGNPDNDVDKVINWEMSSLVFLHELNSTIVNPLTTLVSNIIKWENGENLDNYRSLGWDLDIVKISKKIDKVILELWVEDINNDWKVDKKDIQNYNMVLNETALEKDIRDNGFLDTIHSWDSWLQVEYIDNKKKKINLVNVKLVENSFELTWISENSSIYYSFDNESWNTYSLSIPIYSDITVYYKEQYENGTYWKVWEINLTYSQVGNDFEGYSWNESNENEVPKLLNISFDSDYVPLMLIKEPDSWIELNNFLVDYEWVYEWPIKNPLSINWYELWVLENSNNSNIKAIVKSWTGTVFLLEGNTIKYTPLPNQDIDTQEIVLELNNGNWWKKELTISIYNINTAWIYALELSCYPNIVPENEEKKKNYWTANYLKATWLKNYTKLDWCIYLNKNERYYERTTIVYWVEVKYKYYEKSRRKSNSNNLRKIWLTMFKDLTFTWDQRYLRVDWEWVNFNIWRETKNYGTWSVRRFLEKQPYFFDQLSKEDQEYMLEKWAQPIRYFPAIPEEEPVIAFKVVENEDEVIYLWWNETNEGGPYYIVENEKNIQEKLDTILSVYKGNWKEFPVDESNLFLENTIKAYPNTVDYAQYPFTFYVKLNRTWTWKDYPALVWIEFWDQFIAPTERYEVFSREELNYLWSDWVILVLESKARALIDLNRVGLWEKVDDEILKDYSTSEDIKSRLNNFNPWNTRVATELNINLLNYELAKNTYLATLWFNENNYENVFWEPVYSKSFLDKLYNKWFLEFGEYKKYNTLLPNKNELYELLLTDDWLKQIKQSYTPWLWWIDWVNKAIKDYVLWMADLLDPLMYIELLSAIKKWILNLKNSEINIDLQNVSDFLAEWMDILSNIDTIIEWYSEYDKWYYESYIKTFVALNVIPISKINKAKKISWDNSEDLNILKNANKFSKKLAFESKNGFIYSINKGWQKVLVHIKGTPQYNKALLDSPDRPKSYFNSTNSEEIINLHKNALDKVSIDIFENNKGKFKWILIKFDSNVWIYAKGNISTNFMRIIIRNDWSIHGYPDVVKWLDDIIVY